MKYEIISCLYLIEKIHNKYKVSFYYQAVGSSLSMYFF